MQQKVIQNKINKLLVILPILALLVLGGIYINIYIGNTLMSSFAIADDDNYNFTVSDTTTLTVSLPAVEALTLTPTAEGIFGSKSVSVGVSTNNPHGYSLTMSAATSSLSRSTAVNGVTPTIPTLATAVSEADFPNNFWGFKRTSTLITDTDYQPMRENYNIPVNTTAANADSSNSTITFGVKLSNAIPSGDYSININFLAITNVAPNLVYMQDATSTSLAIAMPNIGDSTVLYDRRDNQEYTVAKLADGKYWMTKNLNLAGGTILTSEDTDMPAGYTLPTANGFQEGNKLPESDYTKDGVTTATLYNANNIDCSNENGCYSYYSWTAATLGSGLDITEGNVDAPYSICPKGWKMPTGRYAETFDASIAAESDFYNLAVAYGFPAGGYNDSSTSVFCNQAGDCQATIPNFVRSGHYGVSGLFYNGTYGQYWTRTLLTGDYDKALYFVFSAGSTLTSYIDMPRSSKVAVRCLFDATMQNFTQADADAMAVGDTETLVDNRDGKDYTVTKMYDGNIWMTEDLTYTGSNLTAYNSNVLSDTSYTLYEFLVERNDGGKCDATNSYNNACYENYSGNVYYNYAAATAMSVTGYENSNTATQDICPAGWGLPGLDAANHIIDDSRSQAIFKVTPAGVYDPTYSGLSYTYNAYLWMSTTAGLQGRNRLV